MAVFLLYMVCMCASMFINLDESVCIHADSVCVCEHVRA